MRFIGGGRWIGWDAVFAWDREDSHSRLSSRYLRTEFKTQAKEIKYATLHLCGLGMYELFINGQRIGDQVLAPAPSDYRRTVLYNSFDVTKQVAGGNADNAIGVTLGNGRSTLCVKITNLIRFLLLVTPSYV